MVVNYVVKKPVEELVKEVQRGKALSKESVIRESESPYHLCLILAYIV